MKKNGDILSYKSEQLVPTKTDKRPSLLLVLGNPATHSVESGMFFSFEGNKKIVENFYLALECNDQKALSKMMAASYQHLDTGKIHKSHYDKYPEMSKDVLVRGKALAAAFPELKIDIFEMIAEGNQVAVRTGISGVQKGKFMGIDPTNKPVLIKTATLFTIEGGKITSIREMWNELAVMKQIGYIVL